MRSYCSGVGSPSNLTGTLIWPHTHTHTHRQERCHVKMKAEMFKPRIANDCQQTTWSQGRRMERIFLQALRRHRSCQHLDLRLATSSTARQYTSVVEATQCEVLTQSLNRHKWDSLWYFGHVFHLAFIKVQNNLSALQKFADPHLITITTGRTEKQAEVCVQKHGLSSEDTEGALLNLGLFPKRLKKGNHI